MRCGPCETQVVGWMWRMIGRDEKCKRDLWVNFIELCDKLHIGDKGEGIDKGDSKFLP